PVHSATQDPPLHDALPIYAIKYTERGEVVLEASCERNQETGGEEAGCMLRFSVRDTGIGIAPDKKDMIFEAFAQADGSLTRKYGNRKSTRLNSSHVAISYA